MAKRTKRPLYCLPIKLKFVEALLFVKDNLMKDGCVCFRTRKQKSVPHNDRYIFKFYFSSLCFLFFGIFFANLHKKPTLVQIESRWSVVGLRRSLGKPRNPESIMCLYLSCFWCLLWQSWLERLGNILL